MNMLEKHETAERKYVFVCGLQRSGTSVLARNIGRLEGCTSFRNTGVPQDEGQYLQDVYPADRAFGGTGRYGFDERAHLTDASHLLTGENIARLRLSWHSHWNPSKPICVEKTPGNLIMTRFLQTAFPNSYFIVVRRHPVPVSIATQRWKVSMTSLHGLFDHWLRCYGLFEEDRQYLQRVYELSYEDYVKSPGKYHQDIARFIGTRAPEENMEELTDLHNKKYFDQWSNLLTKSSFRNYYRYIAAKYEPQFAKYGYSLLASSVSDGERLGELLPAANALGELYCVGADTSALGWRIGLQSQWYLKRQLRARLPKSIKSSLKRVLRGASSSGTPPDPVQPPR